MSVHKLTDGRKGWYFSIRINGKQYKKEKWKNKKMASKTEALIAEQEFKNQMIIPEACDITLYKLYDEFVTASKGTLKASTQRAYTTFQKNELQFAADKPITDLSHLDILNWKNTILELPIGIDYKNRKIKIIKQLLEYGSVVYNIPLSLQKCLLEPIKDYSVKSSTDKEKWLKIEDFEEMMNLLHQDIPNEFYYYVILNVLYYTGLRIGELAALEPEDITPEYINVNKSFLKIGENNIVSAPKTKNSIRKVYISERIYNLCNTYITHFYQSGALFHKETPYLNEQKLRRVLHKLADQCGLSEKYEIKIHNLRHSCNCNLKFIYGLTDAEASAMLGHTEKVSNTIYTHADTDEIKAKISKK